MKSRIAHARELFPAASRIVEAVMERGARTHQEDWRTLPAGFHLARAGRHLDLLVGGDANEPHLAHAVCRLLMELEEESTMKPPQAMSDCERDRESESSFERAVSPARLRRWIKSRRA